MWKGIIAAVILVFLLCLAEGRRELRFFKITRYTLKVPAFKKLDSEKKIILLADLHNKSYGEHNSRLLDAIRKEKPDLILIAGDMLVGKDTASYQEALDFVTRLPAICPVYYGPGNHEQRLKEYPEKYEKSVYKKFKEGLALSGVHYLENQTADIKLDRLPVRVNGLELPMLTYEKFKKHQVDAADIRQCIGRADRDKYQILLAPNPVYYPAYRKWGADLTGSGPLPGGLARSPGLGGVITPQAALFPKYSGEMTVEGSQAIAVSKGLGTHTINLRFCNYAEVVAISLLPYRETK